MRILKVSNANYTPLFAVKIEKLLVNDKLTASFHK